MKLSSKSKIRNGIKTMVKKIIFVILAAKLN